MKIKLFLASIVLFLLGTVLFSEVSFVKAFSNSYTISGEVLYRYNGGFRPATSAMIEALSVTGQQKYTTIVDRIGNYSLTVPNSNYKYKIRAFDNRDTVFLPLVRYVTATTSTDINFQGILKLW